MVRDPKDCVMAQVCMVTGKRPLVGMNVSHSHVRTKKRSMPNLQMKRYWVHSENKFVRLRLSAHGMRIIDKRGIDTVLADIRGRGIKV
jgi:large subunit ribosomal protein L28